MALDIAIVFGTFNRLGLLQRCFESIQRAVGDKLVYRAVIVDGGSTDGTLDWLRARPDVDLIEQGALHGAVIAFNAGFARAVELEAPYVCQFNDDIAFVGEGALVRAVALLEADPAVGAVAFASDRYTPGQFTFTNQRYHGHNYVNQGLYRREAGMAVARFLGDPTGKAWWDRRFHTYAADTVLGLSLWRLGWRVLETTACCVHDGFAGDNGHLDPLRRHNSRLYDARAKALFLGSWGASASVAYNRADAERCGGRLL